MVVIPCSHYIHTHPTQEHGVCQLCGLDAHALYTKLKSLTPPERVQELMQLGLLKYFPESSIRAPQEGHFWQADHQLPVAEGGGCVLLLCVRRSSPALFARAFGRSRFALINLDGSPQPRSAPPTTRCCGIDNLRTLCVPCHHSETAALHQRMKQTKNKAAAAGSKDLRACFGAGAAAATESPQQPH